MTDQKDIAVKGGNAAATAGVNTDNGSTVAPPAEKTAEELFVEANARIAKLSEERDNYKTGMLKAKGKLPDDDGEEKVDVAEIARQAALQAVSESEFGKAVAERDAIIQKALKENAELRLANKNRPSQGTGNGSNQETQAPKDHTLSEEQERALRVDRGWGDAEIERFKALSRK